TEARTPVIWSKQGRSPSPCLRVACFASQAKQRDGGPNAGYLVQAGPEPESVPSGRLFRVSGETARRRPERRSSGPSTAGARVRAFGSPVSRLRRNSATEARTPVIWSKHGRSPSPCLRVACFASQAKQRDGGPNAGHLVQARPEPESVPSGRLFRV